MLSGLKLLIKGVIISILGFIGLMIGGLIASTLGFAAPTMPKGFNPQAIAMYRLIFSSLFYIVLGLFFGSLQQKKQVVFWLVFFFNFIVVNLLTILEGIFFSNIISFPYNSVIGAVESIFVAVGVALFFATKNPEVSFFREIKEWLSSFKPSSLIWRLLLSWIAFVIIYYIVGIAIAPIVVPYYQSGNFELKLPALQTIILLQLGRGALILLVTLPIIALWKKSYRSFFIWFGLLLFVKDVILGLMCATWFPWVIKITHGIELTVDGFLLAGVYCMILVKRWMPRIGRQITSKI